MLPEHELRDTSGTGHGSDVGLPGIAVDDSDEPRILSLAATATDTPDAESVSEPAIEHNTGRVRERIHGHPLIKSLMSNPQRWRLWPAVAVLRWMERTEAWKGRSLTYRTKPALCFAGSEISDLLFSTDRVAIVLNAVGVACAGSPLPASDIARIVADTRLHGALNEWLDGICDRFMHALECMQSRSHSAFAIATGAHIEAHALASVVAGATTPLHAAPDGEIFRGPIREPAGAIGLAGFFVGTPSARGMEALFAAFTGHCVGVREFTGAEIDVAHPAGLGRRMGRLLGRRCFSPEAGVEVHIEGGGSEDAQKWAHEEVRRRSLHELALMYVGSGTPAVRFLLWLDPERVPEGRLDGTMALGGMAVLGSATNRVALPIECGAG